MYRLKMCSSTNITDITCSFLIKIVNLYLLDYLCTCIINVLFSRNAVEYLKSIILPSRAMMVKYSSTVAVYLTLAGNCYSTYLHIIKLLTLAT